MTVLWFLLFAASIAAFFVGLIKPSVVLRWGKNRGRRRSSLFYGVASIVFLIAFVGSVPKDSTTPAPGNQTNSANSVSETANNGTNTLSNQSGTSASDAGANSPGSPSNTSTATTGSKQPKNTTVTKSSSSATSGVCRSNWSAGVYHTYRFNLVDKCKTVSGTVEIVRHEADHDYHLDVKVDSEYTNLLATGNYKYQHGYLVVEIIPMDQPYVTIPSVGEHATFTGAVVDDKDHGWNEVHPAWIVNGKGKTGYTAAAAQESVITGICGNGDKDCPTSSSTSSGSGTSSSGSSTGGTTSTNGLSIVSSTLNVSPGAYATVRVKTKPGAQGTIIVTYKSGPSKSSSLNPQTADGNGYITWTWKVGTNTTPGSYPVSISAAGRTVQTTLHVQ